MDAPSEEKAEGTTEEVKLAEEKSPDGVTGELKRLPLVYLITRFQFSDTSAL